MSYCSIRSQSPRISKSSLEKLEKAGLVKRWVDDTVWTPRKMSALTEKGIKVAEKVREVDSLMTGK